MIIFIYYALIFGLLIGLFLAKNTVDFLKTYANSPSTPVPIHCPIVTSNSFTQECHGTTIHKKINDITTTYIPRLGALTPNQETTEIVRQLSQSLSEKETMALKSVLNNLEQQIDRIGQNNYGIIFYIGSQVSNEDKNGAISQALISLAKQWLKSTPENANQSIMQITKQITKTEGSTKFDNIDNALLESAIMVSTNGSNDINNKINNFSALISQSNTTLIVPIKQVLYQIVLEDANKGGNASNTFDKIESSITQNTMRVDLTHLPMVKTLFHLAQLKVADNIKLLNQIIDKATNIVTTNRNENNIDELLIQQTQIASPN
jgi:hypothetical protein